jgi:hypothetical protein
MEIRILLPALFIMTLPVHLLADDVYRSVDADGNVTYTDKPLEVDSSVEKVELLPTPSEASRLETEERNAAIRKAMEEAREKRLEKEAGRNALVSNALKELEEAEEELKQAKEIDEGDRQTLLGGRSRIKPEYFERVEEAEAKVETARKKLKEIRGY